MKNNKSKMIADGAVCTALTVLLTVIAIYVPLFSLVSVAVVGIPLAYIGIKHGAAFSSTAAVASSIALFIVTGNVLSTVLISVINMLPGVIMGYCVRKRKSFKMSVVLVSGGVLLGVMLQLLVINYSAGGNGVAKMIDETVNMTRDMMSSLIGEISAMGVGDSADISDIMNSTFELMREYIYLYIPSFIVGVSAVTGYMVYMFGIFILKRIKVMNIPYLQFKNIHATRGICCGAVILMLLTTISDSTSVFMSALKNIETLLYAFITVSGLAFIDYKFSNKIKSGYGRFGIYCLVFIFGYLFISFIISILTFIGLFDGMFDYRRIGRAGDNNAERR